MSKFDWRSPASYQSVKDGETSDFAWEILRRNPKYQADYRNTVSKHGQVTPEFRRRWGLCFRS
ncbi:MULTISPECIES: transcriptional regulator domain-containing protein [unclassified Bradyrhizobium]|uniref:transcriptional regulator domain-containing protein n=1 Tax=unclassified Bradyrhizobium TaxID=2631580 RepID=UPI000A07B102|nr:MULTISPECIES: DUF6499 domain-containing protein [unclassified Bradyrhizobium]MCP3460899.1 DUF6499 domain-containing protein [Bradyrhizobium sp. CCGUVB23]MCP3475591.1 DUF6499 domain-containing protein [Bradyrhizobium sp. CCGUVB1N3]